MKSLNIMTGPAVVAACCAVSAFFLAADPDVITHYCNAVRCSMEESSTWPWKWRFHYMLQGPIGGLVIAGSLLVAVSGVKLMLAPARRAVGIKLLLYSMVFALSVILYRTAITCPVNIQCGIASQAR